jgi:hypothetical protein
VPKVDTPWPWVECSTPGNRQTARVTHIAEPTTVAGRAVAASKQMIELAGAVGAVLFLALSFLYDRFYSPLGLEPEDVGLTRTVILSRAAAGVVVIAALAALLALAAMAYLGIIWVYMRFMSRAMKRALKGSEDPLRLMQEKLRGNRVLRMVNSLFPLQVLLNPGPSPFKRGMALSVLSLAGAVVFGLSFFVSVGNVDSAAAAAVAGGDADSLTFLGVRVLDVESRPCRVNWLGETDSEPAELQNDELHCLGFADGNAFFRTSEATIRVPASDVVVLFEE